MNEMRPQDELLTKVKSVLHAFADERSYKFYFENRYEVHTYTIVWMSQGRSNEINVTPDGPNPLVVIWQYYGLAAVGNMWYYHNVLSAFRGLFPYGPSKRCEMPAWAVDLTREQIYETLDEYVKRLSEHL